MREIALFTLEAHAGPYASWPSRSRLIREGVMLDLALPGYEILRQYDTVEGYLLVTDYDCPHEEKTCFLLISRACDRLLSARSFGAPYAAFLLDALEWRDERHFTAVLSGRRWGFTLRSFSIPFLRPRLGVTANP